MPPPINSHCDRCRGEASASRGNQTSGTETIRPSVKVTERASSEQETSTAKTSILSAKVLTPSLQKKGCIPGDNSSKFGHLVRPKPPYIGDRHGLKPKLCVAFCIGDVDMRRLVLLQTVKEEPVAPDSKNRGHFSSVALVRTGPERRAVRRPDYSPQSRLPTPDGQGEVALPRDAAVRSFYAAASDFTTETFTR